MDNSSVKGTQVMCGAVSQHGEAGSFHPGGGSNPREPKVKGFRAGGLRLTQCGSEENCSAHPDRAD